MKIVTASNGKKTLKISRKEWENIGKKAGWKVSQITGQESDFSVTTDNGGANGGKSNVDNRKSRSLISNLKRDLKITWVKDGREFDGDSGALLWSGEGAEIVVNGEKVPAFDYYGKEPTYIFGVHEALVRWSDANGIHWEPYDPGTYLAYR